MTCTTVEDVFIGPRVKVISADNGPLDESDAQLSKSYALHHFLDFVTEIIFWHINVTCK